MPTIQPTVRSPSQTVDDVVPDRRIVPTVEHHNRLAVRHVVAVLVRDEEQLRRVEHPDAAVAKLDARQPPTLIPKDLAFVGFAVPVGVFQDDDSVLELVVPTEARFGIRVILSDPQAAAFVGRDADRIPHVRLVREHRRGETVRQLERLERLGRSQDRDWGFLGIRDFGIRTIREAEQHRQQQQQATHETSFGRMMKRSPDSPGGRGSCRAGSVVGV